MGRKTPAGLPEFNLSVFEAPDGVFLLSPRTPSSTSRAIRTAAVAVSASAAFLAASVLPALAALPTTSTPVLELARTIRTTPFVGTTTSTRDAEGTAYVPVDDSLWLVGDNARSAYEIDPVTGVLKSVVGRAAFEAAPKFGGGAAAGPNRSGDLESLAYDENSDVLYAFSGTCCTSTTLPTAFRLTRDGTGRFAVNSYQPLPSGADYTGAGWNSADDRIYVGKGRKLRTYDFATNTSGPEFPIRNVPGILGLDFTADGRDLLAVTSAQRMVRVSWGTKRIVPGWDFDLSPFGVGDSRGVEVIPNPDPAGFDQLYVYDGYDGRASTDPLRYAVFVFDVSGDGGGGGGGGGTAELVENPGFEVDTSGWNTGGSVATLTRVQGGHSGSFSAKATNGGTTSGNCLLTDSPNWVSTTVSGTYTGSLWVRADAAGAILRLRFREFSGGSLVGSVVVSQVSLTTSWQQVTVTISPQAAGSSTLDLSAFVQNAPPGTCFYADDASITV